MNLFSCDILWLTHTKIKLISIEYLPKCQSNTFLSQICCTVDPLSLVFLLIIEQEFFQNYTKLARPVQIAHRATCSPALNTFLVLL